MRAWLMKHSSIYAARHPAPDPNVVCDGCKGKALPATLCTEAAPHHIIGQVNYSDKGWRYIFCDGKEHQ